MEPHSDGNRTNTEPNSSSSTIKSLTTELESRIQAQRSTQLNLLSSLQTLVPNIVSSLDLSLKIVSSFNGKSFTPTPPLPNGDVEIKHGGGQQRRPSIAKIRSAEEEEEATEGGDVDDDEMLGDGESPLSVVRVMVAECLLQRIPFDPIDSSTVLRKLENDENVTAAEKAALREVGGESGAILAVEMALRSMAAGVGERGRRRELEREVGGGLAGMRRVV